mgnify:CR=1 FL=1
MYDQIRSALKVWYAQQGRELPWRGVGDPYKVWLSEIILQQTRVVQGTPYYFAFTKAFPSVKDLANASEQEVLNLWQGLGYYSRARNLHAAAKYIVEDLDGVFPASYKELLKMKGVGDYTASAIASIIYGEPKAVIDGNVFRVIARLFMVEDNIADAKSRPVFATIADELLDKENPGDFNQAMMDFGALQCAPKPMCSNCPLQEYCMAYKEGKQEQLPIKVKNLKRTKRYFHYFHLTDEHGTWLRERTKKDIWKGLYEFPLLETNSEEFPVKELSALHLEGTKKDFPVLFKKVHKLSHRDIIGTFYRGSSPARLEGYKLVSAKEFDSYPVSRLIDEYLHSQEMPKPPSLFG